MSSRTTTQQTTQESRALRRSRAGAGTGMDRGHALGVGRSRRRRRGGSLRRLHRSGFRIVRGRLSGSGPGLKHPQGLAQGLNVLLALVSQSLSGCPLSMLNLSTCSLLDQLTLKLSDSNGQVVSLLADRLSRDLSAPPERALLLCGRALGRSLGHRLGQGEPRPEQVLHRHGPRRIVPLTYLLGVRERAGLETAAQGGATDPDALSSFSERPPWALADGGDHAQLRVLSVLAGRACLESW